MGTFIDWKKGTMDGPVWGRTGQTNFGGKGGEVRKPEQKGGFIPDFETDDAIWEVKTQTYLTTGTAGEKILGVPFKYCEVPALYSKPLFIVCRGGRTLGARQVQGVVGRKKKFREFYEQNGIRFVGVSELLGSVSTGPLSVLSDEPQPPERRTHETTREREGRTHCSEETHTEGDESTQRNENGQTRRVGTV